MPEVLRARYAATMVSSRLTAEQRAKVFKALSDRQRVAIVDSLAKNGPSAAPSSPTSSGISIALVSHHWEVLVEAGLIRKERAGQLGFRALEPRSREAAGGWALPRW